MAQTGKKINELTAITTVSNETVLPAVYVNGGNANSTANKVSIEQISNKITEDISTVLEGKQDKLTAGDNITIENNVISAEVPSLPEDIYTEENLVAGDGITLTKEDDITTITATAQVPDNVWTQDNLIAGKDISITEVQQPVIDGNTLSVWHFDNSFSNAVSGGTLGDFYLDGSSSSSFSSSVSRFENGYSLHCNNSSNNMSIVYPNSISLGENNFTVDFWIYLTSSMTGSPFWINFKGLGGLRIYYSKFQFLINGNVQAESSDYTTNSWMHFAVERSSSTLNFYLNGTKFGTATSANSLTDITLQQQAGTYVYLDEFRLSNVARYNGQNFTPFDQPYASSSGPVQHQINNMLDITTKQDALTTVTGYDATKTQILKNINGVLTWVNEA